ncbi:putative reverse transcriptase [Purpureocillium lavendulum]|uniref:Reverse transcriptase n=1 Tax=Purpureocillium lavendulum TaxID=1247861 RepID=A0AB34FEH0_9HYPO|nr:putative reverse transcriptase [Purpureocillium lavendulum]
MTATQRARPGARGLPSDTDGSEHASNGISEPPSDSSLPDEKRRPSATQGAMTTLDAGAPIAYYYLEFDTHLPTLPLQHHGPSGDSRNGDGSTSANGLDGLPPCPDLRPYISPLRWGPARKNLLLALSCIATFLTAYTAGAYSPPATIIAHDLDTTRTVVLVGITVFCLGFAFAPMALAPISEIWGRYPVFVVAGLIFVVFQAVCSVMPNIAGMLIARTLVGVGASVFSAVVGGLIADLYDKEDRNTPMALFSGAVLAGTGAGPLVSTALIDDVADPTLAWKWTFWHQVIMDFVLVLAIILFGSESRASVLLSRKAKVLNAWYEKLERRGVYGLWVAEPSEMAVAASAPGGMQTPTVAMRSDPRCSPRLKGPAGDDDTPTESRLQRVRWVVRADEERPPLPKLISLSIRRPFHLLLTEPVVFSFSLWAAFAWGVLYLSFSVVPYLYKTDLDRSSRVYVSMMVAAAVATAVGIVQDHLLKHPQWRAHPEDLSFRYEDSRFWAFMRRRFPAEAPEARLYFTCVTAMMLPAGLLGGFLCPRDMDGYAEAVGLGFALWGIYSIYLATFNYLADTYHVYASSALAAQSFCRNVLGGAFPLLTSTMFINLGLRGAGGLLGGIAAGLSVIPWVLVFWGERIRARSKFAIVSGLLHRPFVNDVPPLRL